MEPIPEHELIPEPIPDNQLRFSDGAEIKRLLSEKLHWVDIRTYHRSKVIDAENHIISLNKRLNELRFRDEQTDSPWDLELKSSKFNPGQFIRNFRAKFRI